MSELEFDEEASARLEAMYLIEDAVRRRGLVREALGARPGDRILDVGCGPGFYCAEIAEEVGPSGSVLGIDLSAAMLTLAERRCGELPNVSLAEGSATAVPAEDGTFDRLLIVQVLEYVPDIPAALTELLRVLKPGGRAVLWDIDWETLSMYSEDPERRARLLSAWDKHLVHRALPQTLGAALRTAGFAEVEMHAHAFAADTFAPDRFFSSGLIPLIVHFTEGLGTLADGEPEAWAAEQRALGERGEFYCSMTQFCFTAAKPA